MSNDVRLLNEGRYAWENHKYIAKVRTKSGKIRYIYADDDGNVTAKSKDELSRMAKDTTERSYRDLSAEKAQKELAYNTSSAASSFRAGDYKQAGRTASEAMNSGKKFIQAHLRYLEYKVTDLFA